MKKIKININRPKADSPGIAARMDFDAVLKGYRERRKGPGFLKPFYFIIAAAVVLISAVALLWNNKPEVSDMQAALVKPAVDTVAESAIKPLIPGMKINESDFACDVKNGDTLHTPAGATIIIPAYAFVDGNGRKVEDSVTIRFREYYDPLDFACSGIPMTYDSAGRKWIFESSGMCEIQGFRGEQPVHIDMATPVTITMPTRFGKNDPNLYRMDSTTGQWTYIGKPTLSTEPKDEIIVVTDSAPGIYPSSEALVTDDPKLGLINRRIKDVEAQIAGLRKPVEPKKFRKDRHHFTIDVKDSEFPELKEYKSVVFEVTDENENFTEEYYNVEWNNTELEEIEPGKKYRLILERTTNETLKKGKGSQDVTDSKVPQRLELIVSPVLSQRDYEAQMKEFAGKFEIYKTVKVEREKKLEELRKEREEYKARLLAQAEAARKLYEEQMKQYKLESQVYASFSADRFGIYNCDRPVTYKHPAQVNASFAGDDSKALRINTMYLLQFKDNSLTAQYINGCCNYPLKYNPVSENALFGILPDQKVAWLNKEDFAKLPTSGKANLNLHVSDRSFSDIKELRAYIGL